ncbi:MAG: VCBS repeat-containing protein [Gammaproteobacteria bacterium]|nr:VCBS repeat-containing protein [Gammaproteobacteria bacterium]
MRPVAQPLGALTERYRSSTRRVDFNGDGREDLLVRSCIYEYPYCDQTAWRQLLGQPGGTLALSYDLDMAFGAELPQPGDFNGDHLTDLVFHCLSVLQWCVAISSGEGGYSMNYGPSGNGYLWYLYLVGDYDGDGFDDLYAMRNSPANWEVIRGSGTGLTGSAVTTGLSTAGGGWTVTDYNGDLQQ